MTKQEFIEEISKYVKKYNKQFGINLVSPIVAQACKESGFGTSELAINAKNILGIKLKTNWQKRTPGAIGGYNKKSGEYYNGVYANPKSIFAVFKSWEECVYNYFVFITTVNNYSGCIGCNNADDYCRFIKAGGYATGPDYDISLINDYLNKYDLYKLDKDDIIIIRPEDTIPKDNIGGIFKLENSPLVSYTNLSTHHSGQRTHKIDTITIHCIVGQWTAKQGCDYFARTNKKASCNYIVGRDGDIGLCVEEKNRSWCSSNRDNDQRAITIECASDTIHPYAITDAALNSLIALCTDICIRNDIKALKWSYNKYDRINHINGVNMTCHRDFAAKACPGDYIYNKEEYIAQEVNKRLSKTITGVINKPITIITPEDTKTEFKPFLVRVKINDLNIRKGPGTNYDRIKYINPGIYTIVEVQGNWGKLKSGAGWINLKYTERA